MKNLFMTLISSFLLAGIAFAQSAPSAKTEEVIDTYYYENSIIEFGEGVDMEKYKTVNPNSEFILNNGNAKVYVILRQDKPLKTKILIVDIYDENEDPYDTFELDINEEWDFTSFTIDFDQKGHFYLDIYNSDNVFISSAEVDIK